MEITKAWFLLMAFCAGVITASTPRAPVRGVYWILVLILATMQFYLLVMQGVI